MSRLVDWGAEQEKPLQNIQATVEATLPFESYDPTDSTILGQIGMQTSRFRSKSMSSSTDNYSFENQVLACYWALVDAECLTMGYQVTMKLELPS